MKSIIPILGAAALASTSACAHVQAPEEGASQEEGIVAEASGSQLEVAESMEQPQPPAPMAIATVEETPAQELGAPTPIATEEQTFGANGPAAAEDKQAESVAAKEPAEEEEAKAAAPAEVKAEYEVGDVSIGRFVLTRAIEDREPVDEANTFAPGERVYAFVQAINGNGEQYDINVRWAKDEGEASEPVSLTVGASPRWRTWTWRNAPEQPGNYRCIIETTEGELIAEMTFEVQEG